MRAPLKNTRSTLHCSKPRLASPNWVFSRIDASIAQYSGFGTIVIGYFSKHAWTNRSNLEGGTIFCCSKSLLDIQILHVSDWWLALHGSITRKCEHLWPLKRNCWPLSDCLGILTPGGNIIWDIHVGGPSRGGLPRFLIEISCARGKLREWRDFYIVISITKIPSTLNYNAVIINHVTNQSKPLYGVPLQIWVKKRWIVWLPMIWWKICNTSLRWSNLFACLLTKATCLDDFPLVDRYSLEYLYVSRPHNYADKIWNQNFDNF